MTGNTNVCRLCLLPVNNFTILDDIKLEMCKSVLSTDIEVKQLPVMCNYCVDTLQKSFDFKTICLHNNDFLNTFRVYDNVKLILQEIVTKTSGLIKQEDELVCRLCLKYFASNLFTDLSRIDDDFFLSDMIKKCLPEINLNTAQNPVICQNCMQSLQSQFNLISTVVDTNDKINDYISYKAINNDKNVDLYEVMKFVSNIKKENSNEDIKLENFDVGQSDVNIKLEIFDDIKQSEVHIKLEEDLLLKEEYIGESCEDQTVPCDKFVKTEAFQKNSNGTYSCNLCEHKTTLRASIILHQQKHQDTNQFKCDECDFVTKWRSSLYHHSWLHNKVQVQMYRCPVCPYETRYKKHLRRHSKRHRDPNTLPEYHCQYCEFSTSDKAYFKLHNRNKHKKEPLFEQVDSTFACDWCNFVTYKKCMLTKHRKDVHKPYICEYCGIQCSRLYHLKQHILTHAKDCAVTWLYCAMCDFKTKHKKSLKTHLLLHRKRKRE